MWVSPPLNFMKFNVDDFAKGKPRLADIGGVLRDWKVAVKVVFSKPIGVADSNVAELLTVLEALRIFVASRWALSHKLIIESDSSNVVNWVINPHGSPWLLKKFDSHC